MKVYTIVTLHTWEIWAPRGPTSKEMLLCYVRHSGGAAAPTRRTGCTSRPQTHLGPTRCHSSTVRCRVAPVSPSYSCGEEESVTMTEGTMSVDARSSSDKSPTDIVKRDHSILCDETDGRATFYMLPRHARARDQESWSPGDRETGSNVSLHT